MGIEYTRRRRKKPTTALRYAGKAKFRGARQMNLKGHNGAVVTRQAHPAELAELEAQISARRSTSPLDKTPPDLPTRTAERLVRAAGPPTA